MNVSRFDREVTSGDFLISEFDDANRRSFILKMASVTLSGSLFLAFLASCKRNENNTIPTGVLPGLSRPNSNDTLLQSPSTTAAPSHPNFHDDNLEDLTLSQNPIEQPLFYIGKIHEEIQINHLLRRAGFGITPNELVHYRQIGLEKTIDHLINYDAVDNSSLNSILDNLNLKPAERTSDLQRWWIIRMAYTQRPLEEKMVLFWHGLLTSGISTSAPLYMYQQNKLFRVNGFGSYTTLVKAISKDPAMLIWLDSRKNKKSAPNENFARELLELFTMGEGTFSENDVKEASRAFTGYFLVNGRFTFKESQHDFGPKNFLSQSGYFSGDEIIKVIFQQSHTAEYISRKLFRFFVHESPEIQTIEKLSTILRSNDYNIKMVMEHLLSSNEFYSQKAYRSKIKSPVDFTVGLLRNTGSETDGRRISNLMTGMGQTLFDPPDVAGWPEGITWVSSATMIQRLNYVHSITFSNLKGTDFNPNNLIPHSFSNSPEEFLEVCLETMVDGNINPSVLALLESYLRGLQNLTDESGETVYSNEEIMRHLAYLILSSPEFQLS